MSAFPFRSQKLYRVRRGFTSMRSNNEFLEGQKLTYTGSKLNFYDGLEICSLSDFETGKTFFLYGDDIILGSIADYFEEIPFPK